MLTEATNDSTDPGYPDTLDRVVPLSELDEFEVADGYPEIRGWDVRDSAGRSIGYVYDLIVDLNALRVRYLDVELDPEFAGTTPDRRVLIPLDSVGLDGSDDGVVLRGIDAADVHALVPYARRGVPRHREAEVPRSSTGADAERSLPDVDTELPRGRHYDDNRLFASELAGRDSAAAAFTPRSAKVGNVTVRTTVESEHVREQVPVVHDEVEIERRVVRPGEDPRVGPSKDGEIRVVLMAEEVVVEKRLVPKEVLIIRKRTVTEERTVQTDVRREKGQIDDPDGQVRPLR